MLLIVVVWSLFVSAAGQQVDNEWLDPYGMLNYDPVTQTMRKPAETEDQKKMKQPTYDPVVERFLNRLVTEIPRAGEPTDSSDVSCDAKIKPSQQTVAKIQTLLKGEHGWGPEALDDVFSQILVDLKPRNSKTWKCRFEDTFGLDPNTIGFGVVIFMVIICTELWSRISWFMQSVRVLIVCFLVSIVSNWLNLYKIAFAEHQNNAVKMDGFNEKCIGVKKIDWTDNLAEWYSTWTLQDDPCKKYYDIIYIDPVLLVPPTKAIAITITTFITEPLKHIAQGINEVLQALLKDLPVTVPLLLVFLTIVFIFKAFMFNKDHDALAGGKTPGPEPAPRPEPEPGPEPAPRHQPDDARNNMHQRQPIRPRKELPRVATETLRCYKVRGDSCIPAESLHRWRKAAGGAGRSG